MDHNVPAVVEQRKTSQTPSTASTSVSPSAIRALEADDWRSAPRSVTVQEAEAVLAQLAGRDLCPTEAEACTAARNLVALYPAKDVGNPDAYVAAITTLFVCYPRDLVKRVCNPVTGLPSRLKFFPTIADVSEAIKLELERRKRIEANARYVLEHAAKRQQQAQEDRQWATQRPTAEERARRVQELLRGAVKGTHKAAEPATPPANTVANP